MSTSHRVAILISLVLSITLSGCIATGGSGRLEGTGIETTPPIGHIEYCIKYPMRTECGGSQ